MKLTIDLGTELEHAMELHLESGVSVQTYTRAALRFFRDMYKKELEGKAIGFGDKQRFTSYNTEVSPKTYLRAGIE